MMTCWTEISICNRAWNSDVHRMMDETMTIFIESTTQEEDLTTIARKQRL